MPFINYHDICDSLILTSPGIFYTASPITWILYRQASIIILIVREGIKRKTLGILLNAFNRHEHISYKEGKSSLRHIQYLFLRMANILV